MSNELESQHDRGIALEEARPEVKPPPMYKVVLLNDDFTPMDFVVLVLTRLFNKSLDEAEAIMMDVHEKGKGVAGSYTREIAETRVVQVHDIAQADGHPFQCEMEPIH